MSKRPTKRRGPMLWLAGRSRRFWFFGMSLPILYVASFGPVIWLACTLHSPTFWSLGSVAYRPLAFACSHSKTAQNYMEGYAEWCRPRQQGVWFALGFEHELEAQTMFP